VRPRVENNFGTDRSPFHVCYREQTLRPTHDSACYCQPGTFCMAGRLSNQADFTLADTEMSLFSTWESTCDRVTKKEGTHGGPGLA